MRSRSSLLLSVLAAVALVVAAASPVLAHSGANAEANLRTRLDSAPPGLQVSVAADGSSITLSTTRSVVVLGYSGEPFLRYAGGTVADNVNSLTSYSAANGVAGQMPRSAGRGPVRWHRLAASPAYTWTDSRVIWSGSRLPAAVRAEPKRDHLVSRWRIPVRVDGHPTAITGRVIWTASTESVGLTVAVVLGVLVLLLLAAAWAARPRPASA